MTYLIAALGLRFALAALIYLTVAAIWIANARGWRSLEMLSMSVIFGFVATLTLLAAMAIGRKIAAPLMRNIIHVPLTVFLFVAFGYVIVGTFMGMPNDIVKDIQPFAGLVAALAVIDAGAGYLLDGWVARRSQGTR